LRDDGRQQGGDEIEMRPPLWIGGVWTPMGDPIDFRPWRLQKKVTAGVDFIQTQGIYDMELFRQQMKAARDIGLHEQIAILAGVIVPRNLGMLRYMDAGVAGVSVPRELMDRMSAAREAAGDDKAQARKNQEEEGIRISVELVEQARETEGVRGVHLQAIEWEEKVPAIVAAAGLMPRPSIAAEA
jgi:methylenetetrahydrofolate reductase (NADPH)